VLCLTPGFKGCVIRRCKRRASAMSSSTLFFDPDLRVRREDHSDGLISWLAAINPANVGLQQGFRSGSERRRCARRSLR
jgi:hypothetical protein